MIHPDLHSVESAPSDTSFPARPCRDIMTMSRYKNNEGASMVA